MAGKLAREIHQTKPFRSFEEELFLNLERTTTLLQHPLTELLKSHGISKTQYNVLRILRGAGDEGLTCSQISERLVTRDSDITRLLDRMEQAKLIARQRSDVDRRVVVTRISKKGLTLVSALDAPVTKLLKQLLGHLSKRESKELVDLLEQTRSPFMATHGG